MTATATHPGVITYPGTSLGMRGELEAIPLTENEVVLLDDGLTIGPAYAQTDATGTLQGGGLKVPIVSGLLWRLMFRPFDDNVGGKIDLGAYNLNTSGVAIEDLVVVNFTGVDATFLPGDAATAALVNNSASATAAALGAQYAAGSRTGTKAVGIGELIYNVLDYGAIGDGATDDYAAFAAAMLAAQVSSNIRPAVVWVPWSPKGYRIGTGMTIPSRVTLRGERRVRLRKVAGTSTQFFLNANSTRGWTVENLTWDDSLGGTTAAIIRPAGGVRDYTIRNCKFVGGAQGISRAIVNKQITSNVATITTDEAHGLEVGFTVTVSHLDNIFDGTYTITAVPTTTSVQFAKTNADVASTPVYGAWLNGEIRRVVTQKASASNTVTLTTSAPHGFAVGKEVYVGGVEGENFAGGGANGAVTITAVTSTTFSYVAKDGIHANIGTTAVSPNGWVGVDSQRYDNPGGQLNAVDHQNGVVGGLIEGCHFEALSNSIRIPDTQGLTVRDNLFTNWTTRCFYIIGQAATATEDLWLVGNRIRDMHQGGNTRQAIAVQSVGAYHKRMMIAHNSVKGVDKSWTAIDPGGADQISLQLCEDYRIVGNYSGFGGDLGINAGPTRRGVISANVCEHNDTAGINLGFSTNTLDDFITVTGNTVMNNGQARAADRGTQAGISLAGVANHCLISGNVIGDDQVVKTTLTGIYVTKSTDIDVSGNLFFGVATKYDVTTGTANSDIRGIPVNTVATAAGTTAGAGATADTLMWAPATIPAPTLAVGQVYRMRVHGNMDFIATPGAFNLRIHIGAAITTATITLGMLTPTTTAPGTGINWFADLDFTIEAIGTSGAMSIGGQINVVSGTTNTRNPQIVEDIGSTYNLSGGLSIFVTANTATANAGNNVRVLRASLVKMS